MKTVSNLRSGVLTRSCIGISLVVLSIVALGGFAARPMLSLEEASRMHAAAERRVRESFAEKDRFGEFQGAAGLERLEVATARVKGLLPTDTSELELHSLLRIVAPACGCALEGMTIEEPTDSGFARLDDMVALRRIVLRGTGPLTSVPEIVSTLRSAGFPTAVLEYSASRLTEDDQRFRSYAVLGIYESTAPPPIEEESLASQGGNP